MSHLLIKKERGLTLIELLVVIAIIGILANIVLITVLVVTDGARQAAPDAVREADMRQMGTTQQMYYEEHERFYEYEEDPAVTNDEFPPSIPDHLPASPSDPINELFYAWEAARRDAVRKADMRKMVTAQQMYYGEHGRYYEHHGFPPSIPWYLPVTPPDPINTWPYIYRAISNVGQPEKFCYYAQLEGGGFYTASHAGNFERVTAPTTLDECAIFSP